MRRYRKLIFKRLLLYAEPYGLILVHIELIPVITPNPHILLDVERTPLEEIRMGDEDLVEKVRANVYSARRARRDPTGKHLAFERSEDDQPELDVDVGAAAAVADMAFRDAEDVEEADAESEVVDYLATVRG